MPDGEDAIDLAEALLDRSRLTAAPRRVSGYLDVSPADAPRPTGLSGAVNSSAAFAATYQRLWQPALLRMSGAGGTDVRDAQSELVRNLARSRPHRMLDVGCGPGLHTVDLATNLAAGGLAVGVDPAEAMVRRAASRNAGEGIAYVRGDVAALPFADDTFDLVVSIGSLCVVEKPYRVVREMVRVTAPGGRIAVFASLRTGWTVHVKPRTIRRLTGFHMFTYRELTEWLRADGLTDIERAVQGQAQIVTARKP
ncbi:class I SAM-dependent methyltransferase [Tsukamurella sp. PLM1]|uniref:class I SAM-dependent methyltransferase n=1 Tax=Tsukamurella sp. PLM1 TaxID=2929795 RepID=UPI0020631628|nr:class I SAM-dependent methyltransferase [Tsukamurella sp. PLM1]BDH56567.1 similarity with UbiE/COQ5 methyltransferase [Tsukamurella sp. PLM1]